MKSSDKMEMWCKRLRLGNQFVETVQNGKPKEQAFVQTLIEGEISRRDTNAIEREIKAAGFPEQKTLAAFDFTDVDLPKSVARPFFTDTVFIQNHFNLFLYGKPGTGKTHLAIALGIEACRRFHKVAFFRLTDLISRLRTLKSTPDPKFSKRLQKLDLIILDEFGYPPLDPDTIELFFEFISTHCYQKKSLIMTSNRTLSEWLSDFPDPRSAKMAQATIDRVAQNTLLLNFHGESRRMARNLAT